MAAPVENNPGGPRRTLRLQSPARRIGRDAAPLSESLTSAAASTDYQLSASVALPPAVRLKAEMSRGSSQLEPNKSRSDRFRLDADSVLLFRRRLFLCSLIAAVPFVFMLACAATNFIELFGRSTIGWSGLGLSAAVLILLLSVAGFLHRRRDLTEQSLRILEIVIFGAMAAVFAYWQFAVLTAAPQPTTYGVRLWDEDYQRMVTIAAALIVHFNWFVLIVFHGVLVPSTAARGIGITLGLAVGALVISAVAAFVHPPTARAGVAVFAIGLTILAAGAGLAIFGTAKMEALRREVLSARETIRQLGQYRLRRKLGQGGMGEVFLAEHHLLKRPCAVKRIHVKYLGNPEQLRRFEREVQATAKLRHPHTVEIYDYGRADDGTFYYVMEYLNGMSLEDLVNQYGPQSPDRVVHILRQACGALKEAHRHGMVHRDIKPSNILLIPDGAVHDQVKVVDFGLVHSLHEELTPEAKITRDGLIVGTPEYMSPEQASGVALDGRSDLFSLGSIAYFLLSGREAFHRDNPMKTLMAVVNDEPQALSNFNPHLPDDLTAILARCLAKTPSDRYPDAGTLEHALAHCKRADHWTEERAADWWTTHPDAQPGTGTDLSTLPLTDGE